MKENQMRRILLASLFALGVGLAGSIGANAAPAASLIPNATAGQANSLYTPAACRRWRNCWWHHGHRVCVWHRRCW
jgi:hypothetical protein